MHSQKSLNLKLAIDESWYEEYGTFLMLPVLATLSCYLIPVFHNEQGLTYLSMIPFTGTLSYGHTLSPRRSYYEKWKKLIDYPTFILASVKKILCFAIPTVFLSLKTSFYLSGYPQELAIFFETIVLGLSATICLSALITYTEEIFKIRKLGGEKYKTHLTNLWKWIIPSVLGFSFLVWAKSLLLLEIIKERS